MITNTHSVQLNLENTPFQDCDQRGLLFFDIETTGLSARSSSVYLIGAVSCGEDGWQARQWFAESPREERVVVQAFLDFAQGFSQIIHFNGDRFDLPYLAEKCRTYRMTNPLETLVSRDLYRMVKPLKTYLGLTSLKQKSLEEYLGIFREDRFGGGELIPVYLDYVATQEESLLGLLLLHNYEDLLGMLSILPMLSYRVLTDKSFQAAEASSDGSSLTIYAWLPVALPKPFSYQTELFRLSGSQSTFTATVPGVQKALKHFYPDYKNYYYLPLEDTAIHKSVAVYVDKEHRQPAKACNCYTKKDGFYLPQKTPLFEPVFKEDYQSRLCYFACTEEFLHDRSRLQAYLEHLLA